MATSLRLLEGRFSVHRLAPDAPLPPGLLEEPFFALLRSPDELSVCCPSSLPVTAQRSEHGWAALAVVGPLDFQLTGILAGLTAPLAAAAVPVFGVSSFDTDYLLVREQHLETALTTLRRAGFNVGYST